MSLEIVDGGAETSAAPAPDARPPEFSDESLALRFTARHEADLRYVAAWGKWLIFADGVWKFDTTLTAFSLARAICREASRECNSKGAKTIASAKTVAAVEKLAKADRQHAATVDQWDSDPWLLNTPVGAIDLRTGDARPHLRGDYMTKQTAVSAECECPLWRTFLDRVTNGDTELQLFLQRVVGYALTGITREHAIFFMYGTGANGKSVFLNTVAGFLRDYHTTASMEVFLESKTDKHPTELAALRGARLVTSSETEQGRRWAESRIKTLTGGDRIAARFMRQDFFEFVPAFKLLVAGNHKPSLRSVDEAIRRRLHLIPFTVTIPPDERDETLAERLKAEWPGILAWAVDGAVEWGLQGLMPPEAVRVATEEYLTAEDALTLWIEECCYVGPGMSGTAGGLFKSWRGWCERTGEWSGSQKRFSLALQDRGYRQSRGHGGVRGFIGVKPRPETQDWDGG